MLQYRLEIDTTFDRSFFHGTIRATVEFLKELNFFYKVIRNIAFQLFQSIALIIYIPVQE